MKYIIAICTKKTCKLCIKTFKCDIKNGKKRRKNIIQIIVFAFMGQLLPVDLLFMHCTQYMLQI